MSANLVVFVEGESDATFLKQLFCYIDFPETRLKPLGGGISKLERAKPVIVRNCEETGRNAIIFDADSDASEKRRALLNEISRLSLPIRHFFFFPNDCDPGCLETLLERIDVPQHNRIYDCFNSYESCLGSAQANYVLPNPKARVYAYCEALGIETNANNRNYKDQRYWDLDSPALQPLINFLRYISPFEV